MMLKSYIRFIKITWNLKLQEGVLEENLKQILSKSYCQKQPPEVRPATLLKRDSNTVAFLWNLGNF